MVIGTSCCFSLCSFFSTLFSCCWLYFCSCTYLSSGQFYEKKYSIVEFLYKNQTIALILASVVFHSGNYDNNVPLIGYRSKGMWQNMTKTPPTIPIEIASRNTPSSFICCNCAITQADFFVTNGSLENTTEVVPLCFQCYVHKRKWKWRVVKEKKRK